MMMKNRYTTPQTRVIFMESEDMLAQSSQTFGVTNENVDYERRVQEQKLWDENSGEVFSW